MLLQMIGCDHHQAGLEIRQQLAFDAPQARAALETWHRQFPATELALLSTCNRVELYAAAQTEDAAPTADELVRSLLNFRQPTRDQLADQVQTLTGTAVVRHLHRVAASLESMVLGESQILSQVKQAYQNAHALGCTGPLLNELFQSALRTAKRVTGETSLHKHRVSIPSVAIADLASCVFETFDDKHVLVLGAGEMAEKTLRYLRDAGRAQIHVINRSPERGQELARTWSGIYHPWDELWEQLVHTDLAISTTAASQPVVTAADYLQRVTPHRHERPLFILDLAVPRDFEPAIGNGQEVYLYSLDDLDNACEQNRQARAAELAAAEKIVEQESSRFLAELHHRSTTSVISGLREGLERPKAAELERLFRRLPNLDAASQQEIQHFADRLVNKMLHPPLESLRHASQNGPPHGLVEALKRLFHLED